MTKINDLPNLSSNNFDPTQDLIIIQKPDGATYKMLAAAALSSINQGEFITETKTSNFAGKNVGRIVFNYSNLLSLNSSVLVQITSSGHSGQFKLTKSAGFTNFENYGVPSTTTNVLLLTDVLGTTSNAQVTATIKLYDDIIELSEIQGKKYTSSKTSRGLRVDYRAFTLSATLQANIKP